MSALRFPQPRRLSPALVSALMLTGCAESRSTIPNWYAGVHPSRQTAAAVPIPVELENDGKPAQPAPEQGHVLPDDPREPWSPNYGKIPVAAAPLPPAAPAKPAGMVAAAPPVAVLTPAPARPQELRPEALIPPRRVAWTPDE